MLIGFTLGVYLLFALCSNLNVILYQEKFLVYISGFMLSRVVVGSPD